MKLATQAGNIDLAMEQIVVDAPSPLVGQTLVESNLRQRFGVIVVGIQRARGKMEFNPAPDAGIQDGDQLVVLGRPESLKELTAAPPWPESTSIVSARILDGARSCGHASRRAAAAGRGVHRPDGRPPGLGIVLVGTHPPSEIYVRNKLKAGLGHRMPSRRCCACRTPRRCEQVVDAVAS